MNPFRYFVDAEGFFLEACDGDPPENAVEVPDPPQHASQKWNGTSWSDAVTIVPETVSAFQARSAIRLAGLLDAVESAVNAADEQTQDAWEYATEWRRDSPTIAALASGLGLTEQQVDELFIAAAQITA